MVKRRRFCSGLVKGWYEIWEAVAWIKLFIHGRKSSSVAKQKQFYKEHWIKIHQPWCETLLSVISNYFRGGFSFLGKSQVGLDVYFFALINESYVKVCFLYLPWLSLSSHLGLKQQKRCKVLLNGLKHKPQDDAFTALVCPLQVSTQNGTVL